MDFTKLPRSLIPGDFVRLTELPDISSLPNLPPSMRHLATADIFDKMGFAMPVVGYVYTVELVDNSVATDADPNNLYIKLKEINNFIETPLLLPMVFHVSAFEFEGGEELNMFRKIVSDVRKEYHGPKKKN